MSETTKENVWQKYFLQQTTEVVDDDSSTSLSEIGHAAEEGAITSLPSWKSLIAGALLGANVLNSKQLEYSSKPLGTQNLSSKAGEVRYYAELVSWLKKYWNATDDLDSNNEFFKYIHYQLDHNFNDFVRALYSLSMTNEDRVPDEAVAQVLIDSSELADIKKSALLGNSIEHYLDSRSNLLIDAAAKALSPSRLGYVHAAKKMEQLARRTKYKYLKRKLTNVHKELLGE